MIVALALVIFMMAILSEAFVHGLEAFRRLKAIADMDSQLRNVTTLLRTDLARSHFEGDERLSDPLFYDWNYPDHRPKCGFFSYCEGAPLNGPTSLYEQSDQFNFPSYRDNNDVLHFSARGERQRREGWYRTAVPPGSPLDGVGIETRYPAASRFDAIGNGLYTSQWGEILWFAVPQAGQVTAGDDTLNPPPTPLQMFNLYRQQLLLVTEQDPATGQNIVAPDIHQFPNYDLSSRPVGNGMVAFNSPADVQFRQRRWSGLAGSPANAWFPEALNAAPPYRPLAAARTGADLVLTNVISFDVKVWDPVAFRLATGNPQTPFIFRGGFVDLGYGTSGMNAQQLGLSPAEIAAGWQVNPLGHFFGNGDQPLDPGAPQPYLARTYDTMSPRDAVTWVPNNPNDPNVGGQYVSQIGGPNPAGGLYSADGFNTLHPFNASRQLDVYPVPYRRPIQMIQIQIRVWDNKTKQTRQVTLVQDL